MSTAEDMIYLYERTSHYYCKCIDIQTCDNCWGNECCCHLQQEVIPHTIGDVFAPCTLNVKCYIRPGEECPICYDPIMTKSSAYITQCGHSFHKHCLFAYMNAQWTTYHYLSQLKCPMCRCALGHPELMQRYKSSYFNAFNRGDNLLDKLEDFWLTHEYILPLFCGNGYDHYAGMHKGCLSCTRYREKGDMMYEITQNTVPSADL